jgi:hypothetical protein
MTKLQIQNFLYDIIKTEEKTIIPLLKFISIEKYIPCEIYLYEKIDKKDKDVVCQVRVNRKWFMSRLRKDQPVLRACLLHEIGHIFFKERTPFQNELKAHCWAIQKSEEMNLKTVTKELLRMIDEWGTFDWSDKKFRIYIKAARKFKKDNK